MDSRINQIPIITEKDGTVKSLNPINDDYIDIVNYVTKTIMGNIQPLIDFIKSNIFYLERSFR